MKLCSRLLAVFSSILSVLTVSSVKMILEQKSEAKTATYSGEGTGSCVGAPNRFPASTEKMQAIAKMVDVKIDLES